MDLISTLTYRVLYVYVYYKLSYFNQYVKKCQALIFILKARRGNRLGMNARATITNVPEGTYQPPLGLVAPPF